MTNNELALSLVQIIEPKTERDAVIKAAAIALLSKDAASAESDPRSASKKAAAPKQETRKKRVAIDWAKAEACRKAGWDYMKIADELGCSYATVYKHFKEKEFKK